MPVERFSMGNGLQCPHGGRQPWRLTTPGPHSIDYLPRRWRTVLKPAQVAELVDALASGVSDRKVVEVRVFSWAPFPL